jgi:hypothetical protein
MGCKQKLKLAKVFLNNSDNRIVAARNRGLKGGGVRHVRPETATTSNEFSSILITLTGRNAKFYNLEEEKKSWQQTLH